LQTGVDASGNLYLGGAGQPSRVTLVVNGDAYLNSNILYNSYTYVSGTSSASVVPQFQLLVKGNIYIDLGNTKETGFYSAQKRSDGTGGAIYTCSLGFKYLTGIASDGSSNAQYDANYYNLCNHPLTIYGSMAAKTIKLGRTYGNIQTSGTVTNQPAEQIVYGPELWLGYMSGSSTGVQPFDAITSLPPIL